VFRFFVLMLKVMLFGDKGYSIDTPTVFDGCRNDRTEATERPSG